MQHLYLKSIKSAKSAVLRCRYWIPNSSLSYKINSESEFRMTCLTHEHKKSVLTIIKYILQFFVKNIWNCHILYVAENKRIVDALLKRVFNASFYNRSIIIIKTNHGKYNYLRPCRCFQFLLTSFIFDKNPKA